MNIAATIELFGGGPGSGCNPDKGKCGRKKGITPSEEETKYWVERRMESDFARRARKSWYKVYRAEEQGRPPRQEDLEDAISWAREALGYMMWYNAYEEHVEGVKDRDEGYKRVMKRLDRKGAGFVELDTALSTIHNDIVTFDLLWEDFHHRRDTTLFSMKDFLNDKVGRGRK